MEKFKQSSDKSQRVSPFCHFCKNRAHLTCSCTQTKTSTCQPNGPTRTHATFSTRPKSNFEALLRPYTKLIPWWPTKKQKIGSFRLCYGKKAIRDIDCTPNKGHYLIISKCIIHQFQSYNFSFAPCIVCMLRTIYVREVETRAC